MDAKLSDVLAGPPLAVEVTTLTGKTVLLEEIAPTSSAMQLKLQYQDREGVPPDQQSLWFPVPEGTAGAQSASAFPWWAAVEGNLEPELKNAMLKMPLALLGFDGNLMLTSVGGAAVLQDATPVKCFMVLSLRSASDTSPSAEVDHEDVIMDAVLAFDDEMDPIRKCFDLFDADKSGKLSVSELKDILTRGASIIDHESAEQIIAQFDTDGDGQISIDEFVKVCSEA